MLRCRVGYCAALLVLVTGSRQLRGQLPARQALVALQSDSVAWQRILVYIVQALSPELVRAAADSQRQPWDLRLPATEPQRQRLATELRTILRARPSVPTDSVTHRLEISGLRILDDTAVVVGQMVETRHCTASTRTTGSVWIDTVRVRRHPEQRLSGAAFSRRTVVGDRVGC